MSPRCIICDGDLSKSASWPRSLVTRIHYKQGRQNVLRFGNGDPQARKGLMMTSNAAVNILPPDCCDGGGLLPRAWPANNRSQGRTVRTLTHLRPLGGHTLSCVDSPLIPQGYLLPRVGGGTRHLRPFSFPNAQQTERISSVFGTLLRRQGWQAGRRWRIKSPAAAHPPRRAVAAPKDTS
jgi:hypothetical protein